MQRIAILLTCHNRKNKTISALKCVYSAYKSTEKNFSLSIYLTDDGSTDGTAKAVALNFPEVNVLKGNGNLFWAGGMRNSWNEALKSTYDAYLLLNDDTNIFETLFSELLSTHIFCLEQHAKPGIYIGSTIDNETKTLSYGGAIFTNRFLAKYKRLIPNNHVQECELGNANIMMVTKEVVDQIGILSGSYIHGLADFDYTLMAKKNKIPVLITPNYLGGCSRDGVNPYNSFHKLSIRERVKVLYNPIGLDFRSNLQYNKRNFPMRLPIVYIMGWVKVIFPKFYLKRHNK